MPTNILSKVALSATGAFAATTYRQRPTLQELWERGGHDATELLDCDTGDSNEFIRNVLGSVWYNRARGSGISRVSPRQYSYRKGCFGSYLPDVTTPIYPINTSDTGYKAIAYGRPWYAYKAELTQLDGVPVQWQSSGSDVDAGDLRVLGQVPGTLTANQIADVDSVADGREIFNVSYKPQRFTVLSDADQNTIWAANADSASTELHRHVVREYRFSARNLTMPTNYLYWASDLNTATGALASGAIPISEGTAKVFPTVNVTMTWLDVPWYPLAAILACIGKVNAATTTTTANPDGNWDYQPSIDSSAWPKRFHNGWPAGTLLFDGVADLVEHTNASGQWVMDITYSFIYRPTGWNYFFNYTTNSFAKAVTKESIGLPQASWKYLYEPTTGFNDLFRLPIA